MLTPIEIALIKALIDLAVSLGGDVIEIIRKAEISEETKAELLARVEEAKGKLRKPEEEENA